MQCSAVQRAGNCMQCCIQSAAANWAAARVHATHWAAVERQSINKASTKQQQTSNLIVAASPPHLRPILRHSAQRQPGTRSPWELLQSGLPRRLLVAFKLRASNLSAAPLFEIATTTAHLKPSQRTPVHLKGSTSTAPDWQRAEKRTPSALFHHPLNGRPAHKHPLALTH